MVSSYSYQVISACCYQVTYDDGDVEQCAQPQNLRTDNRPAGRCQDARGQRCMAGYNAVVNWSNYGRYYAGTVVSCTRGIFSIRYTDGDREQGVRSPAIRSCHSCNRATLTYRTGARVEGNFRNQGRWYAGQVTALDLRTCTYTIRYVDGDTERGVQSSSVRRQRQCSGRYRAGSRVVARHRGSTNCYAGRVCACASASPAAYNICYDDSDYEAGLSARYVYTSLAACRRG